MLNRLHAFAQRKHLIINTAKPEVSRQTFHKYMSMAKFSEHSAGPFMASAFWAVCVSVVWEETFVVPDGLYADQVWVTE
eukprot:720728-Pelagomonas_calceolata.AAC.1